MTAPAGSLAELLGRLAAALDERNARWYLFGAQAVIAHGHPRATADVDLTVRVADAEIAPLLAALAARGLTPRLTLDEAFIRRSRVLPLSDAQSGYLVDIVLAGSAFEDEFLKRARPTDMGGVVVPVIAVEDLIAVKLLAGRPRDLEDAQALLRVNASRLDQARLEDVVRRLDAALDTREVSERLAALKSR